ncbi:MAG: hypothetical protein O3B31_01450 [Chloroflexi bacterium]|nr:hypothetical protein [Chloroflexota bacterium]MDA1002006.1 hypothetical protein [Chloroflexota bacterium]
MVWAGAAAIVLAIAAAIAVGAFFLFRYDVNAPIADIAQPDRPTLLRDATLRAGPAAGDAVLDRLSAGMLVTLIGRSTDGRWLVVTPVDEPERVGWLPADAVGGTGDTSNLTVVAAGGSPTSGAAAPAGTPSSGPTFTPDLPDLALEAVSARDNRLVVSIANLGAGDVTARVLVSVNGAAPQVVGAKPGEPLRAGGRIEWVLSLEYVQRRAVALVTVTTDPPITEETLANNRLEAIVAPDLPNDIEIVDARNVPPDQHLQAVIRNNSPIPIVGPVTLTVRSTDGTSALLGRRDVALNLAAGGTMTVDFSVIVNADFTRVQLLLVTESINDAVALNDVFPR